MLISIITPSLNRAAFIEEAIQSVLAQDYPDFEHIIVDGGSTDGTLEILQRYPHLKVISEPDQGIYDAINKGIGLSQGDLIGVLNSDDAYADGIFREIPPVFTDDPQTMAVSGGSQVFQTGPGGQRQVIRQNPAITPATLLVRATLEESHFNAWFFKPALFQRIGLLDQQYPLLADRDFLIRCALAEIPFASLARTAYLYRQHPGSMTFSGAYDIEGELGQEARRLAANWLDRPAVPPEGRRILRCWHTHTTVQQTLSALKRGAVRRALRSSNAGWRRDPGWPFGFASALPAQAELLFRRLFPRTA